MAQSGLTRLAASGAEKCRNLISTSQATIRTITDIMERRQRYSHYLPLYQSLSRTTSRAASFPKDGTRSPRGSKNGRPSSSAQSAKRRSTMNSRDAAYDEEEELRRAIEASKGEKSEESTEGSGSRRGKRGRSDSEEYVPTHSILATHLMIGTENPMGPKGNAPHQHLPLQPTNRISSYHR